MAVEAERLWVRSTSSHGTGWWQLDERRRLPGSFGYLLCRECKARYVVAGRRERYDSRISASVVCPECKAAVRTELPRHVAEPFRVPTVNDAMRRED